MISEWENIFPESKRKIVSSSGSMFIEPFVRNSHLIALFVSHELYEIMEEKGEHELNDSQTIHNFRELVLKKDFGFDFSVTLRADNLVDGACIVLVYHAK